MKVIKILLLIILLYSCVPSFAPEIVVEKKLELDGAEIEWCRLLGIMDQNFPGYVTIKRGAQTDTVCQSHNIADISAKGHVITVGFYGSPVKYESPIQLSGHVMGFQIVLDTSFVKPEPRQPASPN
jgi:hypothetical protein